MSHSGRAFLRGEAVHSPVWSAPMMHTPASAGPGRGGRRAPLNGASRGPAAHSSSTEGRVPPSCSARSRAGRAYGHQRADFLGQDASVAHIGHTGLLRESPGQVPSARTPPPRRVGDMGQAPTQVPCCRVGRGAIRSQGAYGCHVSSVASRPSPTTSELRT